MKRIAIIGSTGSIGTQALDVIEKHSALFEVEVLSANNNITLLIEQALKFKPNAVVIVNKEYYAQLKEALKNTFTKVYAGREALEQVVTIGTVDIVLTATVGFSGLVPTINAIKAGKTIALANKETLVVAGALIHELVAAHKSAIIPVDSEHSAIFQCIVGEGNNQIDKIILTASGGPFLGKDEHYLRTVTPKEALKHPNWDMGAKVTIDSASLMNKGFEMIEANWLFGVEPSRIEPLVHPQSIIHSMVQFADGSIKAQLGVPDMRLPIQYAFTYPDRATSTVKAVDFSLTDTLTFQQPDRKTFRNLDLAFEAIRRGGNMPCILNAANEIAVDAFLQGSISFTGMSDLIEKSMQHVEFIAKPSLADYLETDKRTREYISAM
ncbi:1-deoxy-D-xylulose 5-phosphate reductoisomerase [Bacteroidia bacterium]|nr:1-deoxy-D-xylulose 5-phosphate reductoisomerase [Bacteroidia bacterium]